MLRVDTNDEQALMKAIKDEDLEDMAEVSFVGDFLQVRGMHRSEELDLIDRLTARNVGFSIIQE